MRPRLWLAAERPLGCPDPDTSPSLACRFESDRSLVPSSSSVSSGSDRSGGSRHQHHGQCCWGPHENQSTHLWGWRQEGCHHLSKLALGYNGVSSSLVLRLHPSPLCHLLPTGLTRGVCEELRHQHHFGGDDLCAGWALQQCQGPGCLEPGAFPTMNGQQRNGVRLGVHLWRHLQILVALFPEMFPPDHIAELKWDHFYGGLPKWLKAMVAYLKVTTNENRHTQTILNWHGKQRRRQWKVPRSWLQPAQLSQEQPVSSLYRSSRAVKEH